MTDRLAGWVCKGDKGRQLNVEITVEASALQAGTAANSCIVTHDIDAPSCVVVKRQPGWQPNNQYMNT